MKNKLYKNIIKILSVICVLTFILTSCGTGVKVVTIKADEFKNVFAEYSGDDYHKSNKDSYEKVSSSGLIELLFDKSTMTVAIHDINSDILWTTLPDKAITKQLSSAPITVELSNGDDTVYTLNSQDNAVNFGNASYTISENGVIVKYAMVLDAETGKSDIDSLTDEQIRVDLSITYTVRDGSFYANVSMNNLSLPEGVYLEKLTMLNDFGAYEESGTEDYIFVPDGSGALIMTGIENKEFTPLELSVYGNDAATENKSNIPCLVGAFGIKKGNGAFLCIIEQGDSIAHINATRNNDNALNSVNASFLITDVKLQQNKRNVEKSLGNQYKNEITLCYRFLSGKSATYSGMATACRENLIRNSVLSTKTVESKSKDIPLVLALQGGYINNEGKYISLTTYEQAKEIMALLKAKGINNAYLRYNGLTDNANNGSSKDFGDFSKKLGNEKSYNELYDYLSSQNFSLFIDTDILTYEYTGKNSAKDISGSNMKTYATENGAYPTSTKSQGYLKMISLDDTVENILFNSADVNFDGYALNDAGNTLYSDYSSDFYSRVTSKNELASQLPVLATSKMLMIDGGNFYTIKNADVVSQLPLSPSAANESASYIGIPFIQMMLHGICEYSTIGINTTDDIQTTFLKSVEYGCLPSVSWYGTNFDSVLDTKYYYNNNINDIVTYYIKANSALSSLRDARMTSHQMVQDGVYCTEYNNSTKVYVNYTDTDVTINGITVSAMDCVAID